MAADLDDLYREIILDHYRSPRRKHHLDHHNRAADGSNPLCGDQIRVELDLEDGHIAEIGFVGQGCSISQASASMMTDHVAGKMPDEALAAVEAFQLMMTSGAAPDLDGFDDIEALMGVAKFPVRVKCASLGWKTLEQALRDGAGDAAPTSDSTDERTATDG